ncbi:hypothetical protein M641_15375 [Listeria monocytogenes]|nr:hypothetical protein M641_15375 [Listeria monocytogenes]
MNSSEKALKKLQKEKDEALSKLDEYVQKETNRRVGTTS